MSDTATQDVPVLPKKKPAPPSASGAQWGVEAEAYLAAHGWRKDGVNKKGQPTFADPGYGAEALPDREVQVPNPQGGPNLTIKQKVCPPIPWSYPVEEAVEIQRARDAAKKK
jgi:hypothetical protein